MLNLSVHRHDGTPLDPNSPETILFYDEQIQVDLRARKPCEMHLFMTVVGHLQDREPQHSVVIYDENLPKGDHWSESVHIRHPRSPLQNPTLEIVVTARYLGEGQAARPDGNVVASSSKFLTPLRPIQSLRSGFLVPFSSEGTNLSGPSSGDGAPQLSSLTANGTGVHARAISTVSAFDTALAEGGGEPADAASPGTAEASGGIEVYRWKAPLTQALELEIRSLRPALERDRVIAEIDLVAGAYGVQINVCDVALDDGLADLMGSRVRPVTLRPYEKYAMCYNLQQRAVTQPGMLMASRKPLSLTLDCDVLLNNEAFADSDPRSRPNVKTVWMPIVDFEGTQGPLPKTPALHMNINSPMPSFTSGGSIGGAGAGGAGPNNITGIGGSSSTLDLISTGRGQSSSNLSLMGGITIMIMGPQFVTLGDQFEWSIKVINRSQRNRIFTMNFGSLSRDLYKHDLVHPMDRLTNLSNYNADFLRRRSVSHYRSTTSGRGIIPLCQELKVGNLAPHVCFETKLQLKALSVGTHTIEDARIEDLSSRDSYDVGGLLEVIVEPR